MGSYNSLTAWLAQKKKIPLPLTAGQDSACVLAAQSYKLTLDFWVIWGLKVSWASAWRCWGEGSR